MKKNTEMIIEQLVERYPALLDARNDIMKALEEIILAYQNGGKIMVCGNGGSAADSLHIVGELVKSFRQKRKINSEVQQRLEAEYPEDAQRFVECLEGAMPAISLVNEVSLITAFSNDKEAVFSYAQQVYGQGVKGDVLIGISTSGNAENVVLASKMARVKDIKVISMTGESGGKLKGLSDVCICAPSAETYIIQEYHLPIYHALCAAAEMEFFGGEV